MQERSSRRVGGYAVTVVETFRHDADQAAVGLDLWRRFVLGQMAVQAVSHTLTLPDATSKKD